MHSNRKATSWRPGSTNFRVAANESTFYRAFFSRSCLLCSTSSTGAPTCSESFTRKKHRNRTTNKRTRKPFLLWEVFPAGTRPVDANRNSKRFQGIKKKNSNERDYPEKDFNDELEFQWWIRVIRVDDFFSQKTAWNCSDENSNSNENSDSDENSRTVQHLNGF